MADLVQTIERGIQKGLLLRRGQRMLVAVSGGVDSMVLLHVLHQLAKPHRWQLVVAHLNHQLRGRSSDADERLVRHTAKNLKLRALIERVDVRALSKKEKLSLEMAARTARHKFLAGAAARLGIRTVVLAHHADDQLELFFLRLLRGSGAQGLAGMKWRSPSPVSPALELLRPLLEIPKAWLTRYAAEHRVKYREDASNASLDFLRNRIRHELLPLLKGKYQPALAQVVGRTVEILRADSEFVQAATDKARQQFNSSRFEDLHLAVQRRLLQTQLFELGINADFDLIEKLRTMPGQTVSVSGTREPLSVLRDPNGVVRLQANPPAVFDNHCLRVWLNTGDQSAEFDGLKVNWSIKRSQTLGSAKPARLKASKPLKPNELFDADRIGDSIILRHWRPGDRFQPIGMHSEVKLQDFFTNHRVPRLRRHQLVIATTSGGEIFWVEGMRISERFKLAEGTIRLLHWAWKRL